MTRKEQREKLRLWKKHAKTFPLIARRFRAMGERRRVLMREEFALYLKQQKMLQEWLDSAPVIKERKS